MNLFSIFRKKERDVLSEYFKFFTKFYKIEKNQQLLGQGSFGTVFKVTNSVDDGEFALKIVRIERCVSSSSKIQIVYFRDSCY